MRALVVLVSILLWASPSLAEQKAPDGFGPIKFGMTKEEAWEAIEGQGHWEEEALIHKVGLPRYMIDFFEVRQDFVQGKAVMATVQNFDTKLGSDGCFSTLVNVLAVLVKKYSIFPINMDYRGDSYPENRAKDTTMHLFNYHDGSVILTSVITEFEFSIRSIEEISCLLSVQYIPPVAGNEDGF